MSEPDRICQHDGCGLTIRRWSDGNLVHVTEDGDYIYIAHKPKPPAPTVTRFTQAEITRARQRIERRRGKR